jgi:hypothetical protein
MIMFKQIFKVLGKTIKTATKTVGKSLDFIDKTLEDQPISSAANKTKDMAGKVIMKAGEGYQKTMDKIEDFTETDQGEAIMGNVRKVSDFVTNKTVDIVESGKGVINSNETLKSAVETLSNAGKKLIEKADHQIEKINDQLEDSIFGEEE